MEINGIEFSALASNDVSVKAYSTDPYINKLVDYLYAAPSVGATDDRKVKTGAFGWDNLHELTEDLGQKLFSDYKTYTINGYKVSLKAGDTLNTKIKEIIEEASDAGASVQKAVSDATNEVLKGVTLAVDVNSRALKDNLEAASKTVVDTTNGVIASIATSLGGAGEVVMSSINGLTRQVSDAAIGAATHFTSGITGVWTGIVKWWQANWGWIALIVGMLIVITVIGAFALIYLKTGGSIAVPFGKR